MEVGTNPKGLLPQETQMAATAHGPAATWEASTYLPTLSSNVKNRVPSDPEPVI